VTAVTGLPSSVTGPASDFGEACRASRRGLFDCCVGGRSLASLERFGPGGAPFEAFAESLGYSVSFESIPGSAGGWCDAHAKGIVIDAGTPANGRVRTLIHELAHALGIDYQRYSRAQAEVIVDTVTYLAAASVGLAVGGETIPYVAGWGENGALEAVTEFAETIDAIARRIEDVLHAGDRDALRSIPEAAARVSDPPAQPPARLCWVTSSRLISRAAASSSPASSSACLSLRVS
jgi:hypothetical protein